MDQAHEPIWGQLITGVLSLASTIVAGWIAIQMAKMRHQADLAAVKVDEAAVKVEKVKMALKTENARTDGKLNELLNKADASARTGDATHALVNSAMIRQLQLHAVMARRMAEITGEQADRDAAVAAEQAYEQQKMKQATLDAGGAYYEQ